VERLTEKENELAELRSQLNRRDRKPKQSFNRDQENQRRLNRLTLDLENDRLLIQKLDELNQQLEVRKGQLVKDSDTNINDRHKNKSMKMYLNLMPK
jgi:hypothetical protein